MPLPLDQVAFSWRGHLSALWWLGLLYRKPRRFFEQLEEIRRWRSLVVSLQLCAHFLPWIVIMSALGRTVRHAALGLVFAPMTWLYTECIAANYIGIQVGILVGASIGIILGITRGMAVGITLGIAHGITIAFAIGMTVGTGDTSFTFALGSAFGISFGIVFGLSTRFVSENALKSAAEMTVAIAIGTALGTTLRIILGGGFAADPAFVIAIATGISFFRIYYLIAHFAFFLLKDKGRWYRWHPVAWDDTCFLPFPVLDRLLLANAEKNPTVGDAEIQRLIDNYPSQRSAALRAQAILCIRAAGKAGNLTQLPDLVAQLPEGDKGYLSQTGRVRQMVSEIARLQARLDTLPRPFFREPIARSLVGEIYSFSARVAGFREPLASEFRAAAGQWTRIATRHLEDAEAVCARNPLPQVFRAGDLVDRNEEAFVERHSVISELEQQVMLAGGCPGILLYGRRRMGKSTLLHSLSGFLPGRVHISILSMQNPEAFISLSSFVRAITNECIRSLGEGILPPADRLDLAGLFEWLTKVNQDLSQRNEHLVLALDEYEQIDVKIGETVFSVDLLATMRESFQKNRRLTWILAGSHDITELKNAPWPSFLVSFRTIEVPPFSLEETSLLLTEPVRYSPMWSSSNQRRPRFDPSFWGEGGIERIHAESGGWPYLVQLIAETAVNLANDSVVGKLDGAMMNRTLMKAVVRGDNVLRLLMQTESTLPGEWDYLLGFRRQDMQSPPTDELVFNSLRRRLLIDEIAGRCRLRVPLMQRWLRQRG